MEENKDMSAGELVRFLQDLKDESIDMMDKLSQMDSILIRMKAEIALGSKINAKQLLEEIDQLRLTIGTLEQEDEIELKEQQEADSLLAKLKKWVNQII